MPKVNVKVQQMADAVQPERDTLPKSGRVNEVCREWLVREDGALAYRLQNEEITEHYTGNKHRNAQVREDFPCALDEQIREQQLAEQAAALYHQMISEQEKIDEEVAKKLAEKIEREERRKKKKIEEEDEEIAKFIQQRDLLKLHSRSQSQGYENIPPEVQPERPPYPSSRPVENTHSSPRKSCPFPLPSLSSDVSEENVQSSQYDTMIDRFQSCAIESEVGLPVDGLDQKRLQEERDAELARQLQEQECSPEKIQLNRDRLLAIEAQDKELAKLLQERERAKARRAKERARQKALAKKQQMEQNPEQLLAEDSYSNPVDVLQESQRPYGYVQPPQKSENPHPHRYREEDYSYPVDVIPPNKTHPNDLGGPSQSVLNEEFVPPPVRPTQLDLKVISKPSKNRYIEPEGADAEPNSVLPHSNIAMAIDPTYPRRSHHAYSPSSQDTSTSSTNSPVMSLPTPDVSSEYDDETSPVPPYMPIQGQRRSLSLEKKTKKNKSKDGCKQQ